VSGKQKLLVIAQHVDNKWFDKLNQEFEVLHLTNIDAVVNLADHSKPALTFVHASTMTDVKEKTTEVRHQGMLSEVPLIMMATSNDLQDKLKAFEFGCDDLVQEDIQPDELLARCHKVIFDKLANDQLKSQVNMANRAAMQAMSSTSDLGVNIQFFLDSCDCSNLDLLGMRMLQATQDYGLTCSLQLRGKYEIKNMEANGMAKELESALLMELKDSGRYFDFGARTVMNYGQASVLIKNMPLDNDERYGQLKDNVFSLVQACDARLKALDNMKTIEEEKETIIKLISRMRGVMEDVDEGFVDIVRQAAEVVEDMGEQIDRVIQFLGLNEEQETELERIIGDAINRNEAIFTRGLKLDEGFAAVLKRIGYLTDDPETMDISAITKLLNKS